MEKNFHTNTAMKMAVNQLNRIQLEGEDPAFTDFMNNTTPEFKLKTLWSLTQYTIKAILYGMRQGKDMTVPGIIHFKLTKHSEAIRDIRRKIVYKSKEEITQEITERLKNDKKYKKHYINHGNIQMS